MFRSWMAGWQGQEVYTALQVELLFSEEKLLSGAFAVELPVLQIQARCKAIQIQAPRPILLPQESKPILFFVSFFTSRAQ